MICLIVGASSGIGRALAYVFAQKGWELILTARRTGMLEEIRQSLPGVSIETHYMDVTHTEESLEIMQKIFTRKIDLVILNAGTNMYDPASPISTEAVTIRTNISGFAALARCVLLRFLHTGQGHLAGVSSIAGLRGSPQNPAYSASKAFVSNYLQGLRGQLPANSAIVITDILPGFVETAMISRTQDIFFVSSSEKAAQQIYRALMKKKKRVFITSRWAFLAIVYRILPETVFFWLFRKTHPKEYLGS